jgi:hypothetical protein
MLELWTHLPKWFKFGTAIALLAYASFLANRGHLSEGAWGIGFLMLVMSFMQPLGPPRRKAPASRPITPARTGANEPRGRVQDDDGRRPGSPAKPDPRWALAGGLAIAVFAALVVAQMMGKF